LDKALLEAISVTSPGAVFEVVVASRSRGNSDKNHSFNQKLSTCRHSGTGGGVKGGICLHAYETRGGAEPPLSFINELLQFVHEACYMQALII